MAGFLTTGTRVLPTLPGPTTQAGLANTPAPPAPPANAIDPATGKPYGATPGAIVQVTFNGITARAMVNPDGTLKVVGGARPADGYTGALPPGGIAPSDLNGTVIGGDGTVLSNVYKGVDPNAAAKAHAADVANLPAADGWHKALQDQATAAQNAVVETGNIQSGSDISLVDDAARKAAGATVDAAGNAVDAVGNAIGGGGVAGGPDPAAKGEVDRANALADALDVDRRQAGAQADTDRGLAGQTRDQQQAAIQSLRDAAEGKTQSLAELQLTRQSGIDAARQQGLAAALQGSNPSAALRQASMGAAKVAGDTTANAVQLRAKEQADNRLALSNALTNARAGDQTSVNTDVTQQGNAQTGETTSQGQGVQAEGNVLTHDSEIQKAKAIKDGALIGAAGAAGTVLLSDRRAKEDVRRTDLADAIGKEVHGVTFEYKPGEGDRDPHFGILAQEIERVIPGVVKKGSDGMRRVDAGQLTMGNTATISELARRIMELEKRR